MKLQQKLAVVGTTVTGFVANAMTTGMVMAQGNRGTDVTSLSITPDTGTGFATSSQSYITTIISVIFVVGALLALAYLVMGGIKWITAGGDKSKTESARNNITAALIGLLILAGAFAIFQVIMGVVGVDNGDVFGIIQPLE